MIFIKRILIYLFLSLSTFFVISAFITKSQNKEPIRLSYVFKELESANIGFDITSEISNLTTSINNLNLSAQWSNGDILGAVVSIGKTIYYVVRFAINMIFDVLIATINIIICILRCIGYNSMEYVHLTYPTVTGGIGRHTI